MTFHGILGITRSLMYSPAGLALSVDLHFALRCQACTGHSPDTALCYVWY